VTTLESRRSKGWGRVETALGSDSFCCENCAGKHRFAKTGTRILWVLGRFLIRVCNPCEKELLGVWKDAGGGEVERR